MALSEREQMWKDFLEAFDRLAPAAREADHQFTGLLDFLRGPRKLHPGPRPLCINGHEYHCRQRNRVKRGK